MSAFGNKKNYDDIVQRSVMIGLLSIMRENFYIDYIRDGKLNREPIPFYVSIGGSDRYVQDFLITDIISDSCENKLDGTQISRPAGILYPTGIYSVNQGSLVSRYARGYFEREQDGKLKRYNAEITSYPIAMNIDLIIDCSNITEMFKISELWVKQFYKNLRLDLEVNGSRTPALVTMPDQLDGTPPIDYRYDEKRELKLRASIEVLTFIYSWDEGNADVVSEYIKDANGRKIKNPKFDPGTVIKEGDRMKKGIMHSVISKPKDDLKNDE